uniref:Uncharacterized protein n=1 Tax=Rhizophora mucronata TaxID=61149 RepID=A0A2P2PEE5_RHIMU
MPSKSQLVYSCNKVTHALATKGKISHKYPS